MNDEYRWVGKWRKEDKGLMERKGKMMVDGWVGGGWMNGWIGEWELDGTLDGCDR